MRYEAEAMMVVRAELCERLDSLRRLSAQRSARDFSGRLASIRQLAAAYGMTPVVRLAEALERSVAADTRGARACTSALYLDRLQDAIGCGETDERASQAMLASVSIRMGA